MCCCLDVFSPTEELQDVGSMAASGSFQVRCLQLCLSHVLIGWLEAFSCCYCLVREAENVKASHRVNVLGFLLHWCVALV